MSVFIVIIHNRKGGFKDFMYNNTIKALEIIFKGEYDLKNPAEMCIRDSHVPVFYFLSLSIRILTASQASSMVWSFILPYAIIAPALTPLIEDTINSAAVSISDEMCIRDRKYPSHR